MELCGKSHDSEPYPCIGFLSGLCESFSTAFRRFRRSGTANVTFFDGHAKSMKKFALNYGKHINIDGVTF